MALKDEIALEKDPDKSLQMFLMYTERRKSLFNEYMEEEMPPDAFAGARSIEEIKAAFGFKLPSREEEQRKKALKE